MYLTIVAGLIQLGLKLLNTIDNYLIVGNLYKVCKMLSLFKLILDLYIQKLLLSLFFFGGKAGGVHVVGYIRFSC